MKKEYMKPVMESETFVANEYVANCYYVTCDKGESEIIKLGDKELTFDRFDRNQDGFVSSLVPPNRFYSGTISGTSGEEIYSINGNLGHPISTNPIKITEDNCTTYKCGPNAS